jgi:hypothetical protein
VAEGVTEHGCDTDDDEERVGMEGGGKVWPKAASNRPFQQHGASSVAMGAQPQP